MSGEAQVELRSIERFDLVVAAAIHAACFDDAWSQMSLAELLAMPGSFGMLAFAGEAPVGLVIVRAGSEDAEILTLCVLPTHRRRAIASRLLSAVRARMSAHGCSRLFLEVADDNAAGKSLYFGQLFLQVGRRTGYYQRGQSKVDALILACNIE